MNPEEDIIDFDALYDAMLECQKGVSWKDSVAHFILNSVEQIDKLSHELKNATYIEGEQRQFTVYQPKKRDIIAIPFRDRIYQRSLNDNIIYPAIRKTLIYDNCSCQKKKGTEFATERMKTHLHQYYRKYGSEGWVLQCDIKSYYPTMPHQVAKDIFKKYLDEKNYERACTILDSFEGEYGFNPGSQIIQLVGISALNQVDHLIKEKYHIRSYIRYMDDFILISNDKELLIQCKKEISEILDCLGFKLNPKKTQIYSLQKGIIFLGFLFKITSTGKVLCFVNPKKYKHDKRELKKMANLVNQGKMTKKQFYNSYQCRRAHYAYGDSTSLLLRTDQYVKELMHDE